MEGFDESFYRLYQSISGGWKLIIELMGYSNQSQLGRERIVWRRGASIKFTLKD